MRISQRAGPHTSIWQGGGWLVTWLCSQTNVIYGDRAEWNVKWAQWSTLTGRPSREAFINTLLGLVGWPESGLVVLTGKKNCFPMNCSLPSTAAVCSLANYQNIPYQILIKLQSLPPNENLECLSSGRPSLCPRFLNYGHASNYSAETTPGSARRSRRTGGGASFWQARISLAVAIH